VLLGRWVLLKFLKSRLARDLCHEIVLSQNFFSHWYLSLSMLLADLWMRKFCVAAFLGSRSQLLGESTRLIFFVEARLRLRYLIVQLESELFGLLSGRDLQLGLDEW